MARIIDNNMLKGMSGRIGKDIVLKFYKGKTIVTKYPDMSKVKLSSLQKKEQSRFAEAVTYAQKINNDPKLKAQYAKKVKKGHTVYNFAMSEFLKKK